MAEFSLPFVCVTGAGLLVVTQRESRGVSEKGSVIYQGHQHFFTERVVAPWNSLPADTDFSSLNRFKRCINAVNFRKFLTVGV